MRRTIAAAFIAIAIAWCTAAPASGHSAEGVMLQPAATQPGGTTLHIQVGVLYTDRDLAREATVTATLAGPGGRLLGPVPLPSIEGALYGGDVQLPVFGTWTVTFSSTGPSATTSITVDTVAGATTTTSVATTTVATTTVAPRPIETEESSSDSSDVWVWVAALVAGVTLAGVILRLMTRRRP